jgi:hypothetical protein
MIRSVCFGWIGLIRLDRSQHTPDRSGRSRKRQRLLALGVSQRAGAAAHSTPLPEKGVGHPQRRAARRLVADAVPEMDQPGPADSERFRFVPSEKVIARSAANTFACP